ncbi:MAG TPA: RecX family transcriptional regulator [Chlamydiales bacterium]|nr:RecX family transcriptional regulator [Chlamydiales bacterium]
MNSVKLKKEKDFLEVVYNERVFFKAYLKMEKHLKDRAFASEEEFRDYFYQKELEMGKKYAFFMFSIRNFLENQLRQKMKARYFSEKTIDEVISVCIHFGYLNDQERLQRLIEDKMYQGYGKKYLYGYLLQKGILKKEIEKVLNDFDDEKEFQYLEEFYMRKKLHLKERNKVYQYLMRRGHSSSHIYAILNTRIDLDI